MFWYDAKMYCEVIGGVMFGNYDGTKDQVEMLFENTSWTSIWLGISGETKLSCELLLIFFKNFAFLNNYDLVMDKFIDLC